MGLLVINLQNPEEMAFDPDISKKALIVVVTGGSLLDETTGMSIASTITNYSATSEYIDGFYIGEEALKEGQMVEIGDKKLIRYPSTETIIYVEKEQPVEGVEEISVKEFLKGLRTKTCSFSTTEGKEYDLCEAVKEKGLSLIDYGQFKKVFLVVAIAIGLLFSVFLIRKTVTVIYNSKLEEKQQQALVLKNQFKKYPEQLYVLLPRYSVPERKIKILASLPLLSVSKFNLNRGKISLVGDIFYQDIPIAKEICQKNKLKCSVRLKNARKGIYEFIVR